MLIWRLQIPSVELSWSTVTTTRGSSLKWRNLSKNSVQTSFINAFWLYWIVHLIKLVFCRSMSELPRMCWSKLTPRSVSRVLSSDLADWWRNCSQTWRFERPDPQSRSWKSSRTLSLPIYPWALRKLVPQLRVASCASLITLRKSWLSLRIAANLPRNHKLSRSPFASLSEPSL